MMWLVQYVFTCSEEKSPKTVHGYCILLDNGQVNVYCTVLQTASISIVLSYVAIKLYTLQFLLVTMLTRIPVLLYEAILYHMILSIK